MLSALSTFETTLHWRSSSTQYTFAIISASVGLVLWIVQFTLQGTCVWTSDLNGNVKSAGYCGFSLKDWHPESFWHTGLAVVWYVTWFVIAVILL